MIEKGFQIKHEHGIGTIRDAAIMIRKAVFIKEQGVPTEIELDDLDPETIHYVGFLADKPITTARVANNDEQHHWHVQRVATIKTARGNGYAAALLQQIITDATQANVEILDLGAQVTAIGFYEKLGFKAEGPIFKEANINHRHMVLHLK